MRKPVLMKTDRARKELRWRPKHTAKATLREMAQAERAVPPAAAARRGLFRTIGVKE